MEKILVSACLLGQKCTYVGGDNKQDYLEELNQYFDIVPFCPEVEGGLPTPRHPSEQRGHGVYFDNGEDVTRAFKDGAFKATQICSYLGIKLAIMKERSPSCGPHFIHDGYFKGRVIPGLGVTAMALTQMGVKVLNEEEGRELLASLKKEKQIKDEKTRIAKERENKAEAPKEEPKFEPKERRPYKGKKFEGHKDGQGKFDRKSPRPFKGKKPGWSYQGKPTRGFGRKKKED